MIDITFCAVLCDGPVGEKSSPQDGSVDSLALQEFHLLQKKFEDIIRANPEKASGLNEKFRTILKEEENEEDDQFPAIYDQDGGDGTHMRVGEPVKILQKRAAHRQKKKKVSKRKKVDRTKKKDHNGKSKKGKRVQTKKKKINKNGKLGKKEKRIRNKNNKKLERKTKKKLKLISKMKQINQKIKGTQENRQKIKFLEKSEEVENCTSLWAELTNVGLGLASSLKKQVMDTDLINSLALAGKFDNKQ